MNICNLKLNRKKINKINALIEETIELADNSLLYVQNRIIQDLQKELSIASIQESDCSVEFEWGFSRDVISKINNIALKRLDTDKVRGRPSRKGPVPPPKPVFLRDLHSAFQTATNVAPKSLTNKSNLKETLPTTTAPIAGILVKELRKDLQIGIETHAPAYMGDSIDKREVRGGFRGGGNPNRKRGHRVGYQRGAGFNQKTAHGSGRGTFDSKQVSSNGRNNFNKERTHFYGNGNFSKERNDACDQRCYEPSNFFGEVRKFSKERADGGKQAYFKDVVRLDVSDNAIQDVITLPVNKQKQNYQNYNPQNTKASKRIERATNQCEVRNSDKGGETKSNFGKDARRSRRDFDRNLSLQKNQGLHKSSGDIRDS